MDKKIVVIFNLLLLVTLLTGCLVKDDSQTIMDNEKKTEIKIEAQEITDDFFEYNSYDSTTNNSYNAQDLIDLFDQNASGNILKIEFIVSGSQNKSLDQLKSELNYKERLFEAFESQLSNTDFKYKSYKLYFDYETTFVNKQIDAYNAVYRIKFQVFEEIDGKKISTPSGIPDGITDNGIIEVHLNNGSNGWKINWMKINFQEIGEVNL